MRPLPFPVFSPGVRFIFLVRRLFQTARVWQQRLRRPPAGILHVGDSHQHDLQGAEAAGFQARLIERGKTSAGPGRIRSLLELEDIAAGVR